jgi:hypothetical protein
MQPGWRKLWLALKVLLATAIVAGVGWQFSGILRRPEIWQKPLEMRPAWIVLSAILYLVGLGFSAAYWIVLLHLLDERPPLAAAIRAYYIAHLGKYAPGKGWALLLRTTLSHRAGVRADVAALTATYETLTTMASGALAAVILLNIDTATDDGSRWKAFALLALAGVPILPGVFNGVVRRVTARFGREGASPIPPLRFTTLLFGLVLTCFGWLCLGGSLWTLQMALVPEPADLTVPVAARYTANMALSYVASFVMVVAPGGLGVREWILQQLLTPELAHLVPTHEAEALATVIALLLRLLWIAAELLMAAIVWWLPDRATPSPARADL